MNAELAMHAPHHMELYTQQILRLCKVMLKGFYLITLAAQWGLETVFVSAILVLPIQLLLVILIFSNY